MFAEERHQLRQMNNTEIFKKKIKKSRGRGKDINVAWRSRKIKFKQVTILNLISRLLTGLYFHRGPIKIQEAVDLAFESPKIQYHRIAEDTEKRKAKSARCKVARTEKRK